MEEKKEERFYNSKLVFASIGVSSTAAYLLGRKHGLKRGLVEGLAQGLQTGIEEGKLEGYVNAIADVASVIRHAQDEE